MDSREQAEDRPVFDEWAVVELLGHTTLAGRCTEETIAGAGVLRIEVPATNDTPAFRRYVGPKALYSITPCSEYEAYRLAARLKADRLPFGFERPEAGGEPEDPCERE